MTWREAVPELTNGEFEEFVKCDLSFIDFFAEWNFQCTMMSPIIEDLSEEFGGKIRFGRINVEDNRKIVEKFQVNSFPTFILLKGSEILEKISGEFSQDEIEEVLKKYL